MKAKDIKPRRSEDVNEAVLKAWNEAYKRGVYRIAVNTDEVIDEKEEKDEKGKKHIVKIYAQKVGYVRKPTREEMSAALTLKNDPLGSAESLMRDCWLGGDEELLDDDDYFPGAMMQFQEVTEVRSGEIKKV